MIINGDTIKSILDKTKNVPEREVLSVLAKAEEKKGLAPEEAALLLNLEGRELKEELFKSASRVKQEIYGERLVFFAPLYISDYCLNDCAYCNFHSSNDGLFRKRLDLEEIEEQARFLIGMGHKRVLLECGEDSRNDIDYVVEAIRRIYAARAEKGNIRRINVNIAATTVENYRKLKSANIGTYQLFQETYHRPTYEKLHRGPKADYERQISAHSRAFEAGIDDLGLGALFGLYDWRFEVLALIQHSQYLEKTLGVGPHTISVPRFCPASAVNYQPEYPVSNEDFLKLIAILRLAVPYTGMIISTRETPEIRRQAFKIGISQASAASVTSIGGYGKAAKDKTQFYPQDERTLAEVIKGVVEDNLLPSFCTACYRKGRTGEAFMELSKPGEIHTFCRPNGLLTFAEYLEDFGNGLYKRGYQAIDFYLSRIENEGLRRQTQERISQIRQGQRDIYF